MSTVDKSRKPTEPSITDEDGFPWLENGEEMDQKTFHERYLRTPEGFKAELIGGVVYVMASPSRNRHGRSDARVGGWLFLYSAMTQGTEVQLNTTTILGEKSEPQPDAALFILEECGGQSHDGVDEDDYTYGAPELLVEVAFSTRSIDLGKKFRAYEKAGVREYLVIELRKKSIQWFERSEGSFRPLPPTQGIHRSKVFPGLWLDGEALLKNDKAAILATVRKGIETPEHAAFVAELQRRKATSKPALPA